VKKSLLNVKRAQNVSGSDMQSSKKFAFDISITFVASIINLVFGLILSVILARYFGAESLGLYRMVFTLYTIGMIFAGIGIPAAVIKYVAEYKENKSNTDKVISSAVITSFLVGCGFSVLFYFSSGIFEEIFNMPGLSGLLRLISPIFPFSLLIGTLLGVLNGFRAMKKFGMATILQSVIILVISIVLIIENFGLNGLIIGIVLSSVGTCSYLLLVTKKYFKITLNGYILITKKLLRFGIQIFGSNAINMINYQADIILIGYFLTSTDVGYYSVAVGFSTFFWLVPAAIQTITYPATSEYWANNNHSALQMMIDKSTKYTACILLPIGLGVGFFAKDIITLIYGEVFINSVLPLLILIMGTVVFGIIKAIGGSVTGAGRPDLALKVISISATINIALNVFLIPHYGIIGAALATMVSLLVNTLAWIFLTIRVLNVKFDFEWFGKIIGITILSIFLFKYFEFINIYLIGIIIIFIHILVTILFFLTKEDKIYFYQLLH